MDGCDIAIRHGMLRDDPKNGCGGDYSRCSVAVFSDTLASCKITLKLKET